MPVRSRPGRVEVSLGKTPNPPKSLLTSWLVPCMAANRRRCVNVCVDGWMRGIKALYKCSLFTIYHTSINTTKLHLLVCSTSPISIMHTSEAHLSPIAYTNNVGLKYSMHEYPSCILYYPYSPPPPNMYTQLHNIRDRTLQFL